VRESFYRLTELNDSHSVATFALPHPHLLR